MYVYIYICTYIVYPCVYKEKCIEAGEIRWNPMSTPVRNRLGVRRKAAAQNLTT